MAAKSTSTKTIQQQTDEAAIPWSDEAQRNDIEKVNEFLRDLAGGRVTIESAFEYRSDDSIKIALPSKPKKMKTRDAAKALVKQAEAEEELHSYSEDFMCTPPDGAYAFNRVLKDLYGTTPLGKTLRTMFGRQLPEMKTVHISPSEVLQVPWGLVQFPALEAEFYLVERRDKDFGWAFQIHGQAKKTFEAEIQGIFLLVHQYLKDNSIYRNTALVGVGGHDGNQYVDPEFLNAYSLDRADIIYNTEVYNSLHHGLWGRIKNRELLASIGQKFSTKVLLWGEPGTGKTVGGLITAQICLENGITFIQARWDEDLGMVMKFAEHVGTPAVVAVEDIEKVIENDPRKMDRLLEIFDGMRTKGREVALLLTSNRPEKLPPSLMRAGRINRMIYVSDLDAEALRRLIDRKIPETQRDDLDYDRLETAFEGFKPSWVVQVLNDAVTASVIRTGKTGEPLVTDDFVQEAQALRPQFEMHRAASDVKETPELEDAIGTLVTKRVETALQSHMVDLGDGEIMVRN